MNKFEKIALIITLGVSLCSVVLNVFQTSNTVDLNAVQTRLHNVSVKLKLIQEINNSKQNLNSKITGKIAAYIKELKGKISKAVLFGESDIHWYMAKKKEIGETVDQSVQEIAKNEGLLNEVDSSCISTDFEKLRDKYLDDFKTKTIGVFKDRYYRIKTAKKRKREKQFEILFSNIGKIEEECLCLKVVDNDVPIIKNPGHIDVEIGRLLEGDRCILKNIHKSSQWFLVKCIDRDNLQGWVHKEDFEYEKESFFSR